MKILVNERIGQHRYKTPEGYLVCTDAILARTGKQEYKRGEIFGDSEDSEEMIEVDRKPEEVFSEKTLASFENKPITVEHPDVDVNPANYKDYSVGFVRDVHKGKTNGQDVILGTLVITDKETIEEIENGEHTDLSCGYDCDIDDVNNPQQKNIRGNHVALCQEGRAGIARIVDSKVEDDETIDYKGIKIGVLHTSIRTLYEVRYNKNKADWPEYKKLENAKKYIDIFLTKGEQAANASWKIDDTIVDSIVKDDIHTYYSTIRNQKFKIKGLSNHRIKMIYEDGKEEEKKESYFKELLQKQIIRIVDSKINDVFGEVVWQKQDFTISYDKHHDYCVFYKDDLIESDYDDINYAKVNVRKYAANIEKFKKMFGIKDSVEVEDEFKPFFFNNDDDDFWENESQYVGNNLRVESFMDKYDDYNKFIDSEFTAKILGAYGNTRENKEMRKYFEENWPQKAKLAHRIFDTASIVDSNNVHDDVDVVILLKNGKYLDEYGQETNNINRAKIFTSEKSATNFAYDVGYRINEYRLIMYTSNNDSFTEITHTDNYASNLQNKLNSDARNILSNLGLNKTLIQQHINYLGNLIETNDNTGTKTRVDRWRIKTKLNERDMNNFLSELHKKYDAIYVNGNDLYITIKNNSYHDSAKTIRIIKMLNSIM